MLTSILLQPPPERLNTPFDLLTALLINFDTGDYDRYYTLFAQDSPERAHMPGIVPDDERFDAERYASAKSGHSALAKEEWSATNFVFGVQDRDVVISLDVAVKLGKEAFVTKNFVFRAKQEGQEWKIIQNEGDISFTTAIAVLPEKNIMSRLFRAFSLFIPIFFK